MKDICKYEGSRILLVKPETDLAQVFINWLKKLFGSEHTGEITYE